MSLEIGLKNKNLYVWGWHSQSQIEALKSFNEANIVKWFSNVNGVGISLNDIIHKPYELQTSSIFIKEEIIVEFHTHFIKFSDMYSRVNYSKSLSIQELLHIFNMYIHFFYDSLKTTEANYVLFSTFPHFGADYVLYLCAKSLGIKTIITFQTLFSNRFFYVESIEEFENIMSKQDKSSNNLIIEQKFEKNLFYMNNFKNSKKKCYGNFFSDSIKLFTKRTKPMTFSGIITKLQECRHFNKIFYKSCLIDININEKYVYFPLQLQPEMTTSMLGNIYSDQLLALEQLSALIPDNWFIYAKENPKQTPRQRGKFFFKRLKSIKKVKYISPKVNTYYLIKHSQFVSVVTGTAGWEAISGGKCALTFGYAWYQNLNGVFRYSNIKNVNEILSYQINHMELERSLNNLLNKAYEGVIDSSYNKLVENYDEKKNKEFLIKFLKDIT
jgi:hypothetical protein